MPDLERHLVSAVIVAAIISALASAQGDPGALVPPRNGPRSVDVGWYLLRDATVHVDPSVTLPLASVEIRDGRVIRVVEGALPATPAGPRVMDCKGLHVYAGFIDPYVDVETPAPDLQSAGAHWNPKVTPQRNVLDGKRLDQKTAESLRKLGFCVAAIAPRGGVVRGQGAVVSTADPTSEPAAGGPGVLRERVYQAIGMSTGFGFGGGAPGPAEPAGSWPSYPSSLMGTIAVIRQTLSDAGWSARTRAAGGPAVIDAADCTAALDPAVRLLFDTSDELDVLRAAKIAAEFHRPGIILGTGREFRRLAAIKRLDLPLIVPPEFPERPRISSPADAENADLRELMAWEQAPTNLRRLSDAGLKVVLTSSKMRDRTKFRDNLREAIRHGLTESAALAMLTIGPAKLLQLPDLGTVAAGQRADLLVTDAPYFQKDAKVRDVWIDGRRHEITAPREDLPHGEWAIRLGDEPASTLLLVAAAENKLSLRAGDQTKPARDVHYAGSQLDFAAEFPAGPAGAASWSGLVQGDHLTGAVIQADGTLRSFTATRVPGSESRAESQPTESRPASAPADSRPSSRPSSRPTSRPGRRGDRRGGDGAESRGTDTAKSDDDAPPDVPEHYGYPFGPYAYDGLPDRHYSVLLTGATVWTSGPAGVIENGFVLLESGRVKSVSAQRPTDLPAVTIEIDCRGKHITPGLIDCHSHTGISRGVNEGGQAVTAEVRVEDVTDPDAIAWYRELAGGITTVNSLHGSANAIGGQNCINKNRWGAIRSDDLHFNEAPPGIKFALGENPRGANSSGERNANPRYPQTRLGVEALIRDRFTAARDYAAARERWRADGLPAATEPRRDLELDALSEVLAGRRLVHCHSYRQDEILMLCRIAQEFGFKIGTFQHVLEGYKIAEVIKTTARGASCFSDWWAYKLEVQDAIPENGAIMHDVGIVVSFNSDSDELARRMNLEAAKAVKYGHLAPDEALRFVTINPAIQLGIERWVGSLEAGKDADLVIWSGHPLSSFTKAEQTWIEGRPYFTLDHDRKLRETIATERKRLIAKVLAAKAKGGDGPPGGGDGGGRGGGAPGGGPRRRPVESDARGVCGCFDLGEEAGRD